MERSLPTVGTPRLAGPVDHLRVARRRLGYVARAALRRLQPYLPDLTAWRREPAPIPVPARYDPLRRGHLGGAER